MNRTDEPPTSSIRSPADTFGGRRTNLRQLIEIANRPLFEFNREECHLAAILFHILNYKDNAARALNSTKRGWEINPNEFGIYFDYSYPRDLWNKLNAKDKAQANGRKRRVIFEMLACRGFETEKLAQIKEMRDFNGFFINRPSRDHIQSPANWDLARIAESLPSDSQFEIACKIKWAFKVKPDIVIHANNEQALCIELKLESGEGS